MWFDFYKAVTITKVIYWLFPGLSTTSHCLHQQMDDGAVDMLWFDPYPFSINIFWLSWMSSCCRPLTLLWGAAGAAGAPGAPGPVLLDLWILPDNENKDPEKATKWTWGWDYFVELLFARSRINFNTWLILPFSVGDFCIETKPLVSMFFRWGQQANPHWTRQWKQQMSFIFCSW